MQLHASCAARDGDGVLLLGPSGCGKSDLLLRLLHIGFVLVADDQVLLDDGSAGPPAALAGLLEIRGIGLVRLPHLPRATPRLAVRLQPGIVPMRLPQPSTDAALQLPLISLDPFHASAPQRIAIALDCVTGRCHQLVGAFAA